MEQKHVLRNIDLFHKSNDYLIKQCTVCMEAWPNQYEIDKVVQLLTTSVQGAPVIRTTQKSFLNKIT